PESQRVFLAVCSDAQGDDEAVIPEVHAVDQQRDQVEGIERRTLPRRELRRRAGDEAAADRALTGPTTLHLSTERLQAPRVLTRGHAHQHLLDDATIERIGGGHCLKRRQRDLASRGPYARALDRDFPTAQDDFALRR